MDSPTYVVLTRQAGLASELRAVANNIANLSTTGFRGERTIFAEAVRAAEVEGGSVSMATAKVRSTDFSQGELKKTGGVFDLAIEGEGFFQVQTPDGTRLTRAGSFTRNAEGQLATPDGHLLLGEGGPVFLPPDAASIEISADGTIAADGRPFGAINLVMPDDAGSLERQDGVLFRTNGALAPTSEASIVQGFVESGNISPVKEMARMVNVQRSYELGQKLLDGEDERIRAAIRTLGQRA